MIFYFIHNQSFCEEKNIGLTRFFTYSNKDLFAGDNVRSLSNRSYRDGKAVSEQGAEGWGAERSPEARTAREEGGAELLDCQQGSEKGGPCQV